jgi:hypothetical protein
MVDDQAGCAQERLRGLGGSFVIFDNQHSHRDIIAHSTGNARPRVSNSWCVHVVIVVFAVGARSACTMHGTDIHSEES